MQHPNTVKSSVPDPSHFSTDTNTDLDPPDPALFFSDLQGENGELCIFSKFLCFLFEGIFKSFFQDKKS
jgi:hypothetical protein